MKKTIKQAFTQSPGNDFVLQLYQRMTLEQLEETLIALESKVVLLKAIIADRVSSGVLSGGEKK